MELCSLSPVFGGPWLADGRRANGLMAVPDVEVHVDHETMSGGARGVVTGGLAIRVGDRWFPEAGWNDFVVVVLGWWCREAAALASGVPVDLRFMDGDCRLAVRPVGGGRVSVRGLIRGAEAMGERDVSAADLVEAIYRAGRAVLAACNALGWASPDVDELREWCR